LHRARLLSIHSQRRNPHDNDNDNDNLSAIGFTVAPPPPPKLHDRHRSLPPRVLLPSILLFYGFIVLLSGCWVVKCAAMSYDNHAEPAARMAIDRNIPTFACVAAFRPRPPARRHKTDQPITTTTHPPKTLDRYREDEHAFEYDEL